MKEKNIFLNKPPNGVIKGENIPRENEAEEDILRKRQRIGELIEKYWGEK